MDSTAVVLPVDSQTIAAWLEALLKGWLPGINPGFVTALTGLIAAVMVKYGVTILSWLRDKLGKVTQGGNAFTKAWIAYRGYINPVLAMLGGWLTTGHFNTLTSGHLLTTLAVGAGAMAVHTAGNAVRATVKPPSEPARARGKYVALLLAFGLVGASVGLLAQPARAGELVRPYTWANWHATAGVGLRDDFQTHGYDSIPTIEGQLNYVLSEPIVLKLGVSRPFDFEDGRWHTQYTLAADWVLF